MTKHPERHTPVALWSVVLPTNQNVARPYRVAYQEKPHTNERVQDATLLSHQDLGSPLQWDSVGPYGPIVHYSVETSALHYEHKGLPEDV